MSWTESYSDPYFIHKCVYSRNKNLLWSYLEFYPKSSHFFQRISNVDDLESQRDVWLSVLNALDHRGHSPLTLAVSLGLPEYVELLLNAGASVLIKSRCGWSPYQEATSLGDTAIMRMLLKRRYVEFKRFMKENARVVGKQLSSGLPDFRATFSWRVKSWIPFLSGHDECTIVKRGRSVRVDFTIVGFERLHWKRGNISFYYNHEDKAKGSATALVDHVSKVVDVLQEKRQNADGSFTAFRKNRKADEQFNDDALEEYVAVTIREDLKSPIIKTVSFSNLSTKLTRATKSSLLMFGKTPRVESIGNYTADVWTVEDITAVQVQREEHLTDILKNSDAASFQSASENSDGFVEALEELDSSQMSALELPDSLPAPQRQGNPSFDEYFDLEATEFVHLGRQPVIKSKAIEELKNKKLTLWTAPSLEADVESTPFPLSLSHLLPLLDLAAFGSNNKLIESLKSFVDCQLPYLLQRASGIPAMDKFAGARTPFPVQIELPVHRLVSVVLSFPDCQILGDSNDVDTRPRAASQFKDFYIPTPKDGYTYGDVLKFPQLTKS